MGAGDRQRFGEARRRKIRGADRPDLPALEEACECFERFLEGDRGVVEVRLVEIDVVAAEPAERIFGGSDHMGFRKPFADIFHVAADLRRDQDLMALAARPQPIPYDRLGFAALMSRRPIGISVGGVEHRKAAIDERVENCAGDGFVGGPAEDVTAQHERRTAEAGFPEFSMAHMKAQRW
jgi:hypothetical protein